MIGIIKLIMETLSAIVIAPKAHMTRKSLFVLNSKNVNALIIDKNNPKMKLTR